MQYQRKLGHGEQSFEADVVIKGHWRKKKSEKTQKLVKVNSVTNQLGDRNSFQFVRA